jgi:PAS domain S-box-containing protein
VTATARARAGARAPKRASRAKSERESTRGALEEELRETVAKFRTLVEQIPAVVYIDPLDPPEPVASLYVSPQVEQLLGVSQEQTLNDREWWLRLVHPEDRDRVLAASHESDRTGDPFGVEYRVCTADGRTVWLHDQSTVVRSDEGAPLFWQGVMMDITDQKKAEDDLRHALEMEREAAERQREADEVKTAFLTAVSHDIRTPLSAILGNAITLENGDRLGITDQERRRLIQSLASKARRLNDIVTDLLDTERLSRGLVEPKLQEIDVGRLSALLVWDSDMLAGREVHVEVRPAPAWVDPQMVSRIVENLLSNAGHHTPAEAQVWLSVHLEDGNVIVVVADDGPGIPDDHREDLFLPFHHGPNTTAHSPGMGIGLSLVQRFAELHGGRAWVEEREGGGAAFHVALPAGDAEGPPARPTLEL